MDQRNAERTVRRRIHPFLFDFSYLTTRAHLRVVLQFKKLLKELEQEGVRLLDLGCGQKPFESLLKDVPIEQHLGVDFDSRRSKPDVVAGVDDLPLDDDSFDAVIASEVFEHTLNLEKAIDELRRVAKNGALVYISTPFFFGEHGVPYDFQRITKYKYRELFKNDEILLIKETNSNLSTPLFVANLCLESLSVLQFIPFFRAFIYAINNFLALGAEAAVFIFGFLGRKFFRKRKQWFEIIFNSYFYTMPGGYDVLVRIKK